MARPFVAGVPLEIDPVAADTLRSNAATKAFLLEATSALSALGEWSHAAIEAGLRSTAERLGVSPGKLFQPMRVALTGSTASPGIFEVLVHLGRDVSLQRLRDAVQLIG